jgi:hypothetical protein
MVAWPHALGQKTMVEFLYLISERKKRERKEPGTIFKTHPSDLLPTARSHLRKFPLSSKIVPLSGDQVFDK